MLKEIDTAAEEMDTLTYFDAWFSYMAQLKGGYHDMINIFVVNGILKGSFGNTTWFKKANILEYRRNHHLIMISPEHDEVKAHQSS